MNQVKRVLLVARYYIIEPLGLLHLAGLAQSLGCEVDVELVKDNDFSNLYKKIHEWKPDFVGFQIWTGWHTQTFAACDIVREMGTAVIIGGPHVTFFTQECAAHADYVVRGDGFRNFRRILQGEVAPGVHFDTEQLAEQFPLPNRRVVYEKYPVLRDSLIRSMITSVGCPYKCSYCYAPEWNAMYGGFTHTQRSVDDIIAEGLEIKENWPTEMIYIQDDIFGYDMKWLEEFAHRWKKEVGLPFHCQIRLELTRNAQGDKRLDLFVLAGCTGITLAIESGNDFLREHVLNRKMSDELILEGCAKIRNRGMTLRTEQILAVPFSNLDSDLSTLDINNRIGPEMAWTSILAPYEGTDMGKIAHAFGFYSGSNDDLMESFFDRTVLRHSSTALDVVGSLVEQMVNARRERGEPGGKPLHDLEVESVSPDHAVVYRRDTRDAFSKKLLPPLKKELCRIDYLTEQENERYSDQIVILQRLFMWFSFLPEARLLAECYLNLPKEEWTWRVLGQKTKEHFQLLGLEDDAARWVAKLVTGLGYVSLDELPQVIRDNPYYYVFMPSSVEFAQSVIETNAVHLAAPPGRQFDELGGVARRWLFMRLLYKAVPASKPIAYNRMTVSQ